ncbi:hypothetical protein [Thalassomonas sp. M1454]|uniref:hypothetical protein n=1 Tax=Thalassomonas sp. M1454 TaxID=2594477 RepID=UPI0021B09DB0|nr:hypothetical protein [Thalassomonas sp. M1454]
MPKPNNALHKLTELIAINEELIPLKKLADRELASIYGLTGTVYTPHIDAYMQVSIKKAEILACLKRQGILAISEVELITTALDALYKNVKNQAIVEYEGRRYERRFLPLKLSKSGKNVQKWAKFWLLLTSEEKVEPNWDRQVKEIWPSYFLIRKVDI